MERIHCFKLALKGEETLRPHYLVGDFIDLGLGPLQGPQGVLARQVAHLYPGREITDLLVEFVVPLPFQEGAR